MSNPYDPFRPVARSALVLGVAAWATATVWTLRPHPHTGVPTLDALTPETMPTAQPIPDAMQLDVDAFAVVLSPRPPQPIAAHPSPREPPMPVLEHVPVGWRTNADSSGHARRAALFYDPASREVISVVPGDRLGAFLVDRFEPDLVELLWNGRRTQVPLRSAVGGTLP